MLMVPDAILEASKLANVVEIVTLPPKSDETLPVTAPDSAMVLAACNFVAVGALSVLRAYLVRSISLTALSDHHCIYLENPPYYTYFLLKYSYIHKYQEIEGRGRYG